MKPNGVFYIAAGRAAVIETQAFLKQRPQADLATQSGPLLDHLVGDREQRRRHGEPEHPGGLGIDD
jgi:uncharacterized protein YigE (DUF2233 family)